MPLRGVRVVEFVGLAPGPFCGKILADFGATVTRIDRTPFNPVDILKNGKRSIALNLKNPKGIEVASKICSKSDVLIEPFRPGVMEKLGLGPDSLLSRNPGLIYARLTGFGQSGSLVHKAGHDINYVALSGLLSLFGRKNEKPTPPINFAADLAGGSLSCAFGILAALFERSRSGKGQVIDAAMVDGTAYLGSWLLKSVEMPLRACDAEARGQNLLDSGTHFYDTYETKDGRFMSVGAIEPQFYQDLLTVIPEVGEPSDQLDDNDVKTEALTKVFKTKTMREWEAIFQETDACVFPVLTPKEALEHPHNRARNTFVEEDGTVIPNPAPVLSRTPGKLARAPARNEMDEVLEILGEIGMSSEEFKDLYEDNAILMDSTPKL